MGTLVLRWDNLGRPVRETSASNTVVETDAVQSAEHESVIDAADGLPNVDVQRGFQLPVIRGLDGTGGAVGASQFATGSNPRVNVVVDGVSRVSSTNGALGAFASGWDVQQVEVARGPQTTLGGRSSLAGAINVVTNDPIFEREGALRFSYETRNGEPLFGLSGVYNTPLSDDVAVRLSFDADFGDEFINVVDPTPQVQADRSEIEDIENGTLRAKLLYAPSTIPGLELVFGYERQRQDRIGFPSRDVGSDNFELSDFTNTASEARLDQDIFSIQANFDINAAWSLEGQLSYQDLVTRIPATNSAFDLTQSFENTQFELLARYQGDGFVSAGVIGVAYEDQDEDGANDTLFPVPIPFVFLADGEFTNKSIFGEIEFAFSESLFAFVGGRYEEQDIRREVDLTFAGVSQSAVSTTADSRFTRRIGFRYEFSETLVVGYQYSEGFRPGSVDVNLLPPVPGVSVFDGETLRQHEAWVRFNDPENRFNLDAAVFHYRLNDAQIPGAGGGRLIANLPEAEGFGLEISGDVALTPNSRLRASLGLLDTEITDVGNSAGAAAFLGQDLPESVGLTFSVGYQYISPAGWDFGIDIQHVGDRSGFAGTTPLPDYTKVDLRVGYDTIFQGRNLRLEAFVENAFDEDIVISTDPNLAAFNVEAIGAPRTIGVSATLRF
ncbi:TonB-dependent receptor [Tateyamaria sp. syn59]|uniref:TonB-dependent receptor n=1 Tax=Tateyamaria sp. syn59 TaxID=2576942 RepID=UPI001678E73A|nr:TonB-dependent receptor [Tateyamaria sp. syn59]